MKLAMRGSLGVLVLVLLAGCSGGGGGTSGSGAAAGKNSIVYKVLNSAPTNTCPNGGITVYAGIDTNGNGTLDLSSEVTSTQYVCNGSSGLTALVSVVTEPSGTNCANGGKKINVGPDANGNNILDASEITSSDYICNGATGGDGHNSLVSIISEPSGTNCANGGSKVRTGLDLNNDGVLEAAEVDSTTYVCNGATGPAGPGITWVDVTGTSVQAASNTGYMADSFSQVTITLPALPVIGDVVQVSGIGPGGWKIAQNAGQSVITRDIDVWMPHGQIPAGNWASVASSSDGTKLVAAANGGQIYVSTDSGQTWNLQLNSPSASAIASSADGNNLVAVVSNEFIYKSINSGATWTVIQNDAPRLWTSVASSSDGATLVAATYPGNIYISTNSGTNWTPRATIQNWQSVASSSNGVNLAAAVSNGKIYTSLDSGQTWTSNNNSPSANWQSLASSSDGAKLVAVVNQGYIYTSADFGATWTPRPVSGAWTSVASSGDGSRLVAVENNVGTGLGNIYLSSDSGQTWKPQGQWLNWQAVASSSDGSNLVALPFGTDFIYTFKGATSTGQSGSISGDQYDAIELQYAGGGLFTVLNYSGFLVVQ